MLQFDMWSLYGNYNGFTSYIELAGISRLCQTEDLCAAREIIPPQFIQGKDNTQMAADRVLYIDYYSLWSM